MENIIKEIQGLLRNQEAEKQKRILMECASRLGTEEWQKAVKDLMERMGLVKND